MARTSHVASFRIAGAPLGPCFPLSTKCLYESLEKVYKYICPVEKWSWGEEVLCVCVLTKEKEETKWWNSEARGAPVVGVVLWRTEKGKTAPKESNGKQSSAWSVKLRTYVTCSFHPHVANSSLTDFGNLSILIIYLHWAAKCNIGIPSLTQSSYKLQTLCN